MKFTSKLKAINAIAMKNKKTNNIVAIFATVLIYVEYFFYLKNISEIEDLDSKYDPTDLTDDQYDELEESYDIPTVSKALKMVNENRENIKRTQNKYCLKRFLFRIVSIIAIEFAIIYFIIPAKEEEFRRIVLWKK